MEVIGIVGLSLLIINGIVTYKGFKDISFFEKYSFIVDRILVDKDYKRLITSGFLHVNWLHFFFNMITLYLFSQGLEDSIGIPQYVIIYFGSLIGGNIFALFIHRNHPDYSAVGASGAISGLIFASIALFPGIELGLILIPVFIPGWLFGILYVLYSIYGIRSQKDNIGHEAHLGGGVIGLMIAVLFNPSVLSTNLVPILLILIPSLLFLYIILKRPYILLVSDPLGKSTGFQTLEDKYNLDKVERQTEIDAILDKINKVGYDNLSKEDKDRLNELN